jgi:hypothetical protein
MEKIVSVFVMVLALMFVAPLAGCFLGGLSGWIAGLVFHDEIIGFLGKIGADTNGLTTWQVGAAMGFLGGFLKTSVSTKKD